MFISIVRVFLVLRVLLETGSEHRQENIQKPSGTDLDSLKKNEKIKSQRNEAKTSPTPNGERP